MQPGKSMIGARTAFALYAALLGTACFILHGKALALAIIVVLGLAAKSYIELLRRRAG
jgi:hypothetical protein